MTDIEFDAPETPFAERLRWVFTAPARLGPRLIVHPGIMAPLLLTLGLAAFSTLPETLSDTGRVLHAQAAEAERQMLWRKLQASDAEPSEPPELFVPVDDSGLVPRTALLAIVRMLAILAVGGFLARVIIADALDTPFRTYFGFAAHAGIVLGVGGFFDSIMRVMRESLDTSFLVGLVAPGVSSRSAVGVLVGVFEPFSLWALWILSVALASGLGWSRNRVLLPLAGAYLGYRLFVAVLAGLAAAA